MQTLTRPSALRRIVTAALDVVLPPRCLACGTTVGATGTLCATCWGAITFLGAPCCACCGVPFEFDLGVARHAALARGSRRPSTARGQ
jgi:predicted amidophosphoribosyltransferase